MIAVISYSTFSECVTGSMKQIYKIIRTEARNGSSLKAAIVWNDENRMLWHFKKDRYGLVITDMAATRPVRHCYDKYQFRMIGGEIA